MNSFTVLLLVFQASLVQNVFSQCIPGLHGGAVISNAGLGLGSGLAGIVPGALSSGYGYGGSSYGGLGLGDVGLGGIGLGGGLSNSGNLGFAASPLGAFGGVGEGNVAVAGELPVAGNTAVIGQVPILGAVGFSGLVPAAGSVSINGRSGCECIF